MIITVIRVCAGPIHWQLLSISCDLIILFLSILISFFKLAVIQKSLRRLGVSSLRLRYFSSSSSSRMEWSTSALSPLSSDTEPSIIVTFADAKYIFNAGENMSRNVLQTSHNWRKTRALFLTQAKIDKISGLGGKYCSYSGSRHFMNK